MRSLRGLLEARTQGKKGTKEKGKKLAAVYKLLFIWVQRNKNGTAAENTEHRNSKKKYRFTGWNCGGNPPNARRKN